MWNKSFVAILKCLEFLPNLHTLKMEWADDFITTRLQDALKDVKLPQIKTLIIPPTAYPLLRHCLNVEDVACVVNHRVMSPDGFHESIASNQDSKVKRLVIPMALWTDPSRKQFNTLG